MCKPTVIELPIHRSGPCYFSVRKQGSTFAAWSLGDSWRSSMANVLRRWADKTQRVTSLTLVAYAPPEIAFRDVLDAVTQGVCEANMCLNDLWRERTRHSVSEDPKSIQAATRIS